MIKYLLVGLPILISVVQLFVRSKRKNDRSQKISDIIRSSSMRYFLYQSMFTMISSLLLTGIFYLYEHNLSVIFLFIGSFNCVLSAFFNINAATLFNIECAKDAKHLSENNAFKSAFQSGIISGLFSSSLAILSYLLALRSVNHSSNKFVAYLICGYVLSGLVIRVSGGIFTKAADIGTDLVGKIEEGIPEDDYRNPGTIADNVGDNIGDCCGIASCSIGTYVAILGFLHLSGIGSSFYLFFVAGVAVTSFVASWFMKSIFMQLIGAVPIIIINAYALYNGVSILNVIPVLIVLILRIIMCLFTSVHLSIDSFTRFVPTVSMVYLAQVFFLRSFLKVDMSDFQNMLIICGGLLLILKVVEIFTSSSYSFIQNAIKSSFFGAGMTIISGINLSHLLIFIITIISSTMYCSFLFNDVMIKQMLLFIGPIMPALLAQDCFGAVVDNAGGIVEMSQSEVSARAITDKLDMHGNMIKAITKVYGIISAYMCFSLLVSMSIISNTISTTYMIEYIKMLFFSVGIIYGLSSCITYFVQRGAREVTNNIRFQFKVNSGILSGHSSPNYQSVINVLTKVSLLPVILCIMYIGINTSYLMVYKCNINPTILLCAEISAFVCGLFMSMDYNIVGAIYDNMKKGKEILNISKKTPQYAALVNADLVGDLYKDATGPSILVFIKLKLIIVYIIYNL